MFKIEYSPEAIRNLQSMRAFDRARTISVIKKHLTHNPHVMGGAKKRIERESGNFIYQLDIGAWRAFYDVDVDVYVTMVQKVKLKGRKTTGEIL